MPINRGKSKKLRKVSSDNPEMGPVRANQLRKSEKSMNEGRSFSDFESVLKKQDSALHSDIFDREKPLTETTNFFSTREGFKLVTYDERVKPVPVDIADHSDDDDLAKVQNTMRTRKDNKTESDHQKNLEKNLATQQKTKGYFSHASKRQVLNFTYDFNGNQIFFEKAKVESLNPMIIDAKAHVPSEKLAVKEDKNFFMGRKKKAKKKTSDQCVELPKVVNKENNNDEMLTFMEPRR